MALMNRRGLLLSCILILTGGCAVQSPRSTTQPAAAPLAIVPLEIRYDPSLHPDELAPRDKEELLNLASEHADRKVRPWFVYVRYNKNGIFAANLYFTPDSISPRIGKGFCAHVEGWSDLLAIIREGPGQQTPRYTQVSRPEALFGNRLEVPLGDLMPFEPENHFANKPAELGDDELVAVVDLVRPVFAREGGGAIFGIETKGLEIRVFSGTSQGPLSGGGRYLDVKRKGGGGFELVDGVVGKWRS